jgi:uncharacterized protein with FMN-binding domain
MDGKESTRVKKGVKVMWFILVPIIVIVAALGGGLLFTEGERREGRNLPIGAVDFKSLDDGTYVGEYAGGMYKWRANKVQVTVASGRVTNISVLEQKSPPPTGLTSQLYDRVIQAQSLQVDTITSATITSKAYLKSVENALVKTQ